VLADPEGPFGSPISDSTRSMIGEGGREVLIVIYAPSSAVPSAVEAAVSRLSERLERFAHAQATRVGVSV